MPKRRYGCYDRPGEEDRSPRPFAKHSFFAMVKKFAAWNPFAVPALSDVWRGLGGNINEGNGDP